MANPEPASWFDVAFDAFIAIGEDGRVLEWNRAAVELFGWKREEAVGQALAELLIPLRYRARHEEGMQRYRRTGEGRVINSRLEMHALLRSGVEIPVEITIWPDTVNGQRRFNSFLRDLSARNQAGEVGDLLAAVVRSTDDAVVTKTLEGVITSWNPAAERLFGYTAPEIVGKPVLTLIPPDRHHEETDILARLRRGERIEHYETVRRTKDGRLLDVALTISPVRDAAGNIVGASKILRDNTERKRTLEALTAARAEAERLSASKDEFLAMLSHELRTPLNAILGWATILERGSTRPEDLARGLDVIKRNVRAQAQLVDDLMDISRIVSGQMRLDVHSLMPITFIQAALDALGPAADAKGVRLESVLDPAAGPTKGDPARLQQVVWNLLSNAVKFTPAGGRVQVTLERVNSHLEISVADTGVGIKPELLPHVFDRYRQGDASLTRQHGGLGLGLAIVKHIVELHGGSVHAKSAGEGRGATFRVHLPVAVAHDERTHQERRHPRRPEPEPTVVKADLGGLDILVVDDEPDAGAMLLRVLEDAGARVRIAHTAARALELVAQAPPSLLISDIGMPGMDGYEFLRRVRALGPERGRVPAIALTAFARSEDRTRALLAGFLTHVAKPVEPAEIIATVASIAGRTGNL